MAAVYTAQSKALRVCLGAMKSTPVNALHIEAQNPTLYLKRLNLSSKYILKLKFFQIASFLSPRQLNLLLYLQRLWITG